MPFAPAFMAATIGLPQLELPQDPGRRRLPYSYGNMRWTHIALFAPTLRKANLP